jgi:hypothetical protein
MPRPAGPGLTGLALQLPRRGAATHRAEQAGEARPAGDDLGMLGPEA